MDIQPPGGDQVPVRVRRHIRGGMASRPADRTPWPARGKASIRSVEDRQSPGSDPTPARVRYSTRAVANHHPLGCPDLPSRMQRHSRPGQEQPPSGCKAARAPMSGYFLSSRRHGSLNGFRALARRPVHAFRSAARAWPHGAVVAHGSWPRFPARGGSGCVGPPVDAARRRLGWVGLQASRGKLEA